MPRIETANLDDALAWSGLEVFDREGERVGRLTGVYADSESRRPDFGVVRTGLFGLRSVLVPLEGAFEENGALILDLHKQQIKGAPHLRREEPLTPEMGHELYAHYGMNAPAGGRLALWEHEHAR